MNIEIECTPEEARRAIGLPDLTPIHDRYIAMVMDTMTGNVKPEMLEQLTQGWAPMGEAGLALWQRLLETGMKAGTGTASG